MKPIGGYFELETARGPHSNAQLALNRAAHVAFWGEHCRAYRVKRIDRLAPYCLDRYICIGAHILVTQHEIFTREENVCRTTW